MKSILRRAALAGVAAFLPAFAQAATDVRIMWYSDGNEGEVARDLLNRFEAALGAVPRPPFWSGYRVVPERIEFWKQKPFRRHERILYTRENGAWQEQWLFP